MAYHRVTFYPKNLRILNPDLHKRVFSIFEINNEELPHTITADKLDAETRAELLEALVLMGKMPAPGSMEEHNAMNAAIMSDVERQGKIIQEKNAAIARLDQYGRERGLLPSDRNIKAITDFIDNSPKLPEHFRGRWTVQTVDIALSFLRHDGVLEFGKKEVPAPPPPPEEVLGTLPDGTRQLSLKLPVPGSASAAQARDYLARVRAQQQPGVIRAEGFKAALR